MVQCAQTNLYCNRANHSRTKPSDRPNSINLVRETSDSQAHNPNIPGSKELYVEYLQFVNKSTSGLVNVLVSPQGQGLRHNEERSKNSNPSIGVC